MKALLVDIGATNFRVGVAHGKKIQELINELTPSEWAKARTTIIHQAQLQAVEAVMIGLPGTIDADGTELVRSPNLSSWVGQQIKNDLQKVLRVPVVLENDSLLNAIGEAVYGAGKRSSIVGFITVSTGVNGAKIIDGQPDVGAFSYELGLLPIHGVSIESIISGRALSDVHGVAPETLPQTTWQAVERSLSTILLQMMLLWRPEVMVIAGPMVREKMIDLKRVTKLLMARWQHPAPVPKLLAGTLDDHSGLYGGLAYLDLHSEAIFGRVQKRS
jgi:glucokinase